MPPSSLRIGALIGLALLVTAAAQRSGTTEPLSGLGPLASPGAPGSAEPHLTVSPEGAVWMSWLEPRAAGGHALRAARLDGAAWTKAVTIAQGDSFFVNWADFPMLLAPARDHLVASYLWKSGAGTYAYDVRLVQSRDAGATWSAPIVPHRDGTPTEHGFVSLVAGPGGTRAVWLDGRKFARDSAGHWLTVPEGTAEMTIRTAMLAGGAAGGEQELDPRVCDCCQTAAVTIPGGTLVAYRDRSATEVRDIWLAREQDGRWSTPYPLHADGWTIAGCPVNGPSLAARGARVAAAWFTGAHDTSRVLVAFSDDGGATFGAPVHVDGGEPLGRVQVVALDHGDALVCWLEAQGKEALVQVRRVHQSGALGPPMTVARTTTARGSGFPRIALRGDQAVLAWTEAGKPSTLRTAIARVPPPPAPVDAPSAAPGRR